MIKSNAVLSENLHKALELFVEMTGVSPDQTQFTIRFGDGMSDLTVKSMYEDIEESFSLDPSNITAYFLLDAYLSSYLDNQNFSVKELLENPDNAIEYIAKSKDLRELVRAPEVTNIGNTFKLSMRQALRHYKALTTEVEALLEDNNKMAYIRRDALRSIKSLRVDQFLKGDIDDTNNKPSYLSTVHQFWNVNSLIETACNQPSGVALNLIRDPQEFHSYFAFNIRNGGNLFTLSDVSNDAHPLQKHMSRRPDRRFDSRASKNWFPYGLMDIAFDQKAQKTYIDKSSRTSLIPLQQEFDKLKDINQLEAEEIIWIVMMFDLIVNKFWNQKYQAPCLSYTGQMIKEELPLIKKAKQTNLPVKGYQPLSLPRLDIESIKAENLTSDDIGHDGNSPLKWMEDRYINQVNDETINLMSLPNHLHYLTPVTNNPRIGTHQNHENALMITDDLIKTTYDEDKSVAFFNKEGRYNLETMDGTSFGTKKELESNRKFIARKNAAAQINKLAEQEYFSRKDEVIKWWREAVNANIEKLYELSVNEDYWTTIDEEKNPHIKAYGYKIGNAHKMMQRFYDVNSLYNSTGLYSTHIKKKEKHCHITGAVASYYVAFMPQTADDLALLAGCKVNELPDVLVHWAKHTDSEGNQILSRVDPMAWALNNPWAKAGLNVILYLSKRGLESLSKNSSNRIN
jgi:hypothetical protein